MDSVFYKEWFQGFSEGLEALDENSRQSIIYVGRNIWGESTRFSVKNQGTVLSGNKECRFIIEFE